MARLAAWGAVLVWISVIGVESKKTWIVGDSKGWSASINFSAWADSKLFNVGDELVFPYSQGAQDVAEVRQGDFENCNGNFPISRWIDGDTHVNLTTPGRKYFICTFPGHCPLLRLAIDVGSGTNSSGIPGRQVGSDANTVASMSAQRAPPPPYSNRNMIDNSHRSQASNISPSSSTIYVFSLVFLLAYTLLV
ncbi:hypothetical protein KP509_20G012900 [Ceratopteris richardii]|uniref:Phytocyanin domain-containing protein n=1 Tax=Ceratopteris richardii TaxID=49495 RepID=A0A8T2SD68_CERRI|nr:hypothetical protein KP509_20G012900 [Ceratopteris richardii]